MALNERNQSLLAKLEKEGLLDQLPEGFLESLQAEEEKREAREKAKQEHERVETLSSMSTTNPPYNSVLLDHELVKLLADNDVGISDAAHALTSFALVGVLLPDTSMVQHGAVHAKDLWGDDRNMIIDVAKSFSNAGIPLHPKAQFSIYNLLPPISSDFLMSTHPCAKEMNFEFPDADMVMISYILNENYGAGPSSYGYNTNHSFPELTASAMIDSMRATDALTSVSALHRDPDVWAQASYNLGAKFIVARGGVHDEVSSETLETHPLSVTLKPSDPNGSQSNIGIVGRKNAMQDYAEHINPESKLGTAIQNALN